LLAVLGIQPWDLKGNSPTGEMDGEMGLVGIAGREMVRGGGSPNPYPGLTPGPASLPDWMAMEAPRRRRRRRSGDMPRPSTWDGRGSCVKVVNMGDHEVSCTAISKLQGRDGI
jgi:hypothetical protein